uniref:TLC domain-containing protein n=1 Tax=Timema monikensis TaxID=170555 RepID=A0A7R9HKJ7_9NEOP|nr:unnamed protein product [Timema monikensis]
MPTVPDKWRLLAPADCALSKGVVALGNCVSSSSSIVLRDWVCGVHMVMYSEFSAFIPLYYLRGSLGDCVFGFVYLMELSTPFVSFRGILSKLKMKSSHLYVVNGLAMLVTFFFCRVVMFPYVCYLYSRLVGLTYWQVCEGPYLWMPWWQSLSLKSGIVDEQLMSRIGLVFSSVAQTAHTKLSSQNGFEFTLTILACLL